MPDRLVYRPRRLNRPLQAFMPAGAFFCPLTGAVPLRCPLFPVRFTPPAHPAPTAPTIQTGSSSQATPHPPLEGTPWRGYLANLHRRTVASIDRSPSAMQSSHRPQSHVLRLDTPASLRAANHKPAAQPTRPARRRSLQALRQSPQASSQPLSPVCAATPAPFQDDEACDWESWLYAGGDLLMGLPD